MTAPAIPLHPCGHDKVNVAALLADDRIAAAVAAPVVPGTTEKEIDLWMVRYYRHIAGTGAEPAAVCALLQQRNPDEHNTCVLAKVAWHATKEYGPMENNVSDWLASDHGELRQESLTDVGNARRLAVLSGADIAHDSATGWRIFADSLWISDADGTFVQRAAKGVARDLKDEAKTLGRLARAITDEGRAARVGEQAGHTAGAARGAESAKLIAAMIKLVRDEPGVLTRAGQWDANPRLLACPGATIELTDDGHAIRPPRRADRLTKVTKGRPGTGAPGPLLKALLARSLPDPEVRIFVQKLMGYGLQAGNPKRLFPIFLGPTSTGKTTFGEVVRHALGDHAGPFSLALFRGKLDEGPRTDVVKALGRRMIFASEASKRWLLHADEINRLTGNDTVQARDLYTKADAAVERAPAFMPVLCANHVPTVLGADPATWRRLIAVPWKMTISQADEDENLGEKIRIQEADAVLDWCLHGWDLYCAFGLDQPHAVVQETMKLRESLTVADAWLVEHTEQDAAYSVTSASLWAAYREYCENGRIPAEQMGSIKSFTQLLRDRGFKPVKVDKQRGWQGLRLERSDFAEHTSG